MRATIELKNLSKIIHAQTILKDVSFSVPEGKVVGLIGKSGSGKTTLFRCINGLEEISSGEIFLFGKNISGIPKENRRLFQQRIGTIFQNFQLLSRANVFENVAFPLRCRHFPKALLYDRVMDVLELVGLLHKSKKYPSELSGGQCQRVAIARALAAEDVSLLLCDEFTSALDPETTFEILSLLLKLNQQLKLTIFLITHDMTVIREMCDEVIVLDQGCVVERGAITDILLRPQHCVTQSLVGSLFQKDLPEHMSKKLTKTPPSPSTATTQVMLRMIFADQVAGEPIIASLVEQFNLPINIIAGHLDHVRTTAFGQLIVSFPYVKAIYDDVLIYLSRRQVATELLGYF